MLLKKILKFCVYLVVIIPVLFIAIDYLGIGIIIEKIYRGIYTETNLPNQSNLHKTNYYDKLFKTSPYLGYGAYPHPLYLTGNPFKKKDIINQTATGIVNLDKKGFRISYENRSKNIGILLGGSTAFGIFATSDDKTISSFLNKKQSKVNFKNLSVPSWNSYQELLAIINSEHKNIYQIISLTGWNDFNMYNTWCKENYEYQNIIGAPSVWIKFEKLLFGQHSYFENFKSIFPYSFKIINKLNIFHNKTKKECNFNKIDIKKFANKFVKNYELINKISTYEDSKNSNLNIFLQPLYLPEKLPKVGSILNSSNKEDYFKHYNFFINEILKSKFCQLTKKCHDLRSIFHHIKNKDLMVYQNPNNPGNALIVDPIHFTDKGNEIIAEKIVNILKASYEKKN